MPRRRTPKESLSQPTATTSCATVVRGLLPELRRGLHDLVRVPSVSVPDRRAAARGVRADHEALHRTPASRVGRLDLPGTAPVVVGEIPALPGAPTVVNILMHVGALRAWDGRPPVGIRLCIEGHEEIGSGALPAYPATDPALFAADALLAIVRAIASLHDDRGDVAVKVLRRNEWDGPVQTEEPFRELGTVLDGLPLIGTGGPRLAHLVGAGDHGRRHRRAVGGRCRFGDYWPFGLVMLALSFVVAVVWVPVVWRF